MHSVCTMYIVHLFLHAWWKRKKCGKIWQSLIVWCSANLIYKHKRNPELLVFWLVAHERKKSTHTCTCLPAQRQIMSNLILLLILFYDGDMYEVIWRKSSELLSLNNFLKRKFFFFRKMEHVIWHGLFDIWGIWWEKENKPQFSDERKKNTNRSAFDKRLIWSPALLQRTSIV